ncbi:ADP-ribosylation/crystallin J1 [Bradyrhizobium sp. SSUT77]|uniref:ADP-ribosylation/crystallin J1 n=1 Tax=Bradyrhizobium sp. SSUT77 TaxID=3040603 RepID=UPI0024489454|nr:ADP-ribosylation/crystallin J1 [Bradyrhizobium sp. SSUT77]MDH2344259.1 ADP-ribosylation/crystallin J1 [Bradyrhizobium sp. SSUT77]
MSSIADTVTLWRPVGPKELELIQQTGMRTFPPRLPDQPIFYPVLTEDYAIKIARDWNVPASGSGFVTRFEVKRSFIERYDVQEAGGRSHLEYWIPAEDLDAFNAAIVGLIEVVRSFP